MGFDNPVKETVDLTLFRREELTRHKCNSLVGVLLFPFVAVGSFVVLLRRLFPIVFFFIAWSYLGSVAYAFLATVLASVLFFLFAVKMFVEFGVFWQTLLINPIRWVADPIERCTRLPVSKRCSWVHLAGANAIVTYSAVYFGTLAVLVATTVPLASWSGLMVIVLANASVRFGLLTVYGLAAKNRQILLLRRFGERPSEFVSGGLAPMIAALGNVRTAFDASLPNSEGLINPEDIPIADIEFVEVDSSNWKPKVSRMIQDADIIVFDLAEPTNSLAWELAVGADNAKPMMLTVPLAYSVDTQHELLESLSLLLVKEVGCVRAREILNSLHSPIPYGSTLLVNFIASCMVIKQMRKLCVKS